MTDQESKHRGRIQAQGNKLEASESWSQEKPPSVVEGLNFLESLKAKITKSQFLEREKEFKKAEDFIIQAGENGGIDAKVSKTFKKKEQKTFVSILRLSRELHLLGKTKKKMVVSKYLYCNFLTDKRLYNLNRGYWKKMLISLGKELSIPFYNEHFANGKPFYDGNPIISAYIPSLKKSIRIIQEVPEMNEVEIGVWTEDTEFDNENIKELVISLELSQESSKIAKKMIIEWLQGNWNENQTNSMLEKTYS